jgi:hypothetical protein
MKGSRGLFTTGCSTNARKYSVWDSLLLTDGYIEFAKRKEQQYWQKYLTDEMLNDFISYYSFSEMLDVSDEIKALHKKAMTPKFKLDTIKVFNEAHNGHCYSEIEIERLDPNIEPSYFKSNGLSLMKCVFIYNNNKSSNLIPEFGSVTRISVLTASGQ